MVFMKLKWGPILIVVQVVFLILKWANIISWNWVLVLLPLIIIGIIMILIIITSFIEALIINRRRK